MWPTHCSWLRKKSFCLLLLFWCCDQISDKSSLRESLFCFTIWENRPSFSERHGGRTWCSCSCVHGQEAEADQGWYPVCFLYFILFLTPHHGMITCISRVVFPTNLNHFFIGSPKVLFHGDSKSRQVNAEGRLVQEPSLTVCASHAYRFPSQNMKMLCIYTSSWEYSGNKVFNRLWRELEEEACLSFLVMNGSLVTFEKQRIHWRSNLEAHHGSEHCR